MLRQAGLHLAVTLLLSAISTSALAYSGNGSGAGLGPWPDGEYYNGKTSTCAGCHTGTPYTGVGPVFGGTYSMAVGTPNTAMSIRASSSNAIRIGFSAAIYDSLGVLAGTFSTSDATVRVNTGNQEITHSTPQLPGNVFDFNWTAPTTPGTYTMYTCINQVNNDTLGDANDGPPLCGTKAVSVTNTAPVATADSFNVGEDSTTQYNVKTNDNDGDAYASQTLSVTAFNTTGTTGSVTNNGSGSFTYNPNGQFEYLAFGESTTDVFTYTLSDGYTTSIGTATVTINGANDTPTVSVVNGSGSYVEGSAPTPVISSATVSDVDTTDLISGATVQITNYVSGQDSLACNGTLNTGNLTGITSCGFSAGTLTLSGTTSKTNYQSALQTVTYSNSSLNPTTGARTIAFKVIDDSGQSNNTSAASNASVTVSAVSTPPVITGFSGTASFTEGTPVIVDSTSTLSDPDSTLLTQAVMTLTTNYDSTQDLLVCPGSLPSGITCGYSAAVLTLSSAGSSLANFQTAIHAVQFNNTSQNPSTLNRTVTLTVRDESSTQSGTASKTISITPVNDPPSFTTVPNMTAVEGVSNSVNYPVNETDPDDSGAGLTYSLSNQPTGMTISNSSPSFGLITWTPPRTGVDTTYSGIKVTVADGGEDGAVPATQTFAVTVSPPDSDGDGVADYSDNCPSAANASQADMDNDTVHILPQTDPSGIPANGDVDPTAKDANGFLTGGDACDEDIDGDGMPNTYENLYSFLNPLDPTDASKDYDGDGITNLNEYLGGTPPDVDNVPPVITVPDAKTVNSTGYLTNVDLGFASAIDGNDGSISSIVPIIDATISLCSDLSNYPLTAPPFRPGLHTANWTTCDRAGNISYAAQTVRVRPILSAPPGQTVGAGQTAVVKFMLNGPAADYPVSVHYQPGGTASSSDYNLSSGILTISSPDVDGNNPGLVGKLSVPIASSIAQDEILTISLSNATNAALGPVNTTQIAIVNHDTTPVLSTAVTQNGVATGRAVYLSGGTVVITVNTSDTNTATAPTFDWSMTDNTILTYSSFGSTANSGSISFGVSSLGTAGLYPVVVTVNDNGQTNTARFILNVVASAPGLVADCNLDGAADTNTDCDGDGIANTAERVLDGSGYDILIDSNGNGIPDYLDDNRIVDRNVLQNETGDPANTYLLATDPGLQLRLGATALASGASGALVSQQNISDHGGPNGGAGVNPQDSDSNDGGFYDFEVTGLNDVTTSARVVIPLQAAILDNAVYRKYNGSAWSSFVVDANNTISSAPGNGGVCPAPGSIEYTPGLTPLNTCVQLLIEDGGPNDTDGVRDYVIRDPGGVGVPPAEATPAPDKTKGGAGAMNPALLLLMLAVFFLLVPRRKLRSQPHKTK